MPGTLEAGQLGEVWNPKSDWNALWIERERERWVSIQIPRKASEENDEKNEVDIEEDSRVNDSEKSHDEEETDEQPEGDTEKSHEEEETDEQTDVDMEVSNKANLDEDDTAALE